MVMSMTAERPADERPPEQSKPKEKIIKTRGGHIPVLTPVWKYLRGLGN